MGRSSSVGNGRTYLISRGGGPDAIARVEVYLVSEELALVPGSVIDADGDRTTVAATASAESGTDVEAPSPDGRRESVGG
jgi:hypothetical protein